MSNAPPPSPIYKYNKMTDPIDRILRTKRSHLHMDFVVEHPYLKEKTSGAICMVNLW